MSEFDGVVRYPSRMEESKTIVPERIREACTYHGMSYEEAAAKCGIGHVQFGRMANGHDDIPDEMIFKLMGGLGFPKGFFYRIKWKRV